MASFAMDTLTPELQKKRSIHKSLAGKQPIFFSNQQISTLRKKNKKKKPKTKQKPPIHRNYQGLQHDTGKIPTFRMQKQAWISPNMSAPLELTAMSLTQLIQLLRMRIARKSTERARKTTAI